MMDSKLPQSLIQTGGLILAYLGGGRYGFYIVDQGGRPRDNPTVTAGTARAALRSAHAWAGKSSPIYIPDTVAEIVHLEMTEAKSETV